MISKYFLIKDKSGKVFQLGTSLATDAQTLRPLLLSQLSIPPELQADEQTMKAVELIRSFDIYLLMTSQKGNPTETCLKLFSEEGFACWVLRTA